MRRFPGCRLALQPMAICLFALALTYLPYQARPFSLSGVAPWRHMVGAPTYFSLYAPTGRYPCFRFVFDDRTSSYSAVGSNSTSWGFSPGVEVFFLPVSEAGMPVAPRTMSATAFFLGRRRQAAAQEHRSTCSHPVRPAGRRRARVFSLVGFAGPFRGIHSVRGFVRRGERCRRELRANASLNSEAPILFAATRPAVGGGR